MITVWKECGSLGAKHWSVSPFPVLGGGLARDECHSTLRLEGVVAPIAWHRHVPSRTAQRPAPAHLVFCERSLHRLRIPVVRKVLFLWCRTLFQLHVYVDCALFLFLLSQLPPAASRGGGPSGGGDEEEGR